MAQSIIFMKGIASLAWDQVYLSHCENDHQTNLFNKRLQCTVWKKNTGFAWTSYSRAIEMVTRALIGKLRYLQNNSLWGLSLTPHHPSHMWLTKAGALPRAPYLWVEGASLDIQGWPGWPAEVRYVDPKTYLKHQTSGSMTWCLGIVHV